MGITNRTEDSPSSPDLEETLPLYEESRTNEQSDLTPPDDKATPDECRDFIVQASLQRGVGIDHARRVAAKWTSGTGRELSQYPVAMFRDIFGPEDAWNVYKIVKVPTYKKEQEKKAQMHQKASYVTLATFCILFAGCVVILTSNQAAKGWKVTAGIGAVGSFFGALGIALSLFADDDIERRVETELKAEMYKPLQSSGS